MCEESIESRLTRLEEQIVITRADLARIQKDVLRIQDTLSICQRRITNLNPVEENTRSLKEPRNCSKTSFCWANAVLRLCKDGSKSKADWEDMMKHECFHASNPFVHRPFEGVWISDCDDFLLHVWTHRSSVSKGFF